MHCYYACLLNGKNPFAIQLTDRKSKFIQHKKGAVALTFGLII